MAQYHVSTAYSGSAPENYERYFVPAIGGPLAVDLVDQAAPRPGERVLDVACGTGIVARLAAERVGPTGGVAGLDVNPGMLAVARAATPPGLSITWHEASAEAMPLADDAFDLVLCQVGLQFMRDKPGALREMRRVLAPGGRLCLNLPGPTPRLFAIMDEELTRHISPATGQFVQAVFSLHDTDELRRLITDAGFHDVTVDAYIKTLRLPPPEKFLWEYVYSTPLGAMVGQAKDSLAALERDVVARWQAFAENGGLQSPVRMIIATAWT
jgi:ubiquinone/menaquinone biosynthesis C-methylase UbiE